MNKAWKDVERRAARFFGAERTLGSGSLGRDDRTKSDSTHPILFIEAKRRKGFLAALRQARDVASLANLEKKYPVLYLQYGGDAWIMVRAKDFKEVAFYAK